jgi:hypothetical protein
MDRSPSSGRRTVNRAGTVQSTDRLGVRACQLGCAVITLESDHGRLVAGGIRTGDGELTGSRPGDLKCNAIGQGRGYDELDSVDRAGVNWGPTRASRRARCRRTRLRSETGREPTIDAPPPGALRGQQNAWRQTPLPGPGARDQQVP